MTEGERIAWGTQEHHLRLTDIAAVKAGTLSLEAAQANARRRSRQSGMTPSRAHAALCDAQRAMREL